MKINFSKYFFIIVIFIFSCQKKEEKDIRDGKTESLQKIQISYKEFSVDSIKVKVEYYSELDTINSSEENERFVFLYWTKTDISTEEMEEIIENDDKYRMKKENLIGYNLGDKRSIVLKYKYIPDKENYLAILVEDLAFINDFDKDSTRIIQNISTIKEKVFESK